MSDAFEPKHTPGPWTLGKGTVRVRKESDTMSLIAECYTTHHAIKYPREQSEREANARLIAAAPELLEVVFNVCCLGDGMDSETWPEVLADARKALDKAEGRQ